MSRRSFTALALLLAAGVLGIGFLLHLASCDAGSSLPAMKADVVAVDLVEKLSDAAITQNDRARVKGGLLFAGGKRVDGVAAGGERPAILAAPPSTVVFRHQPVKGEQLGFGAGLDLDWPEDAVGSVRFRVTIDSKTIFDRTLDRSTGRSGDWVDMRVDLDPFAGREIAIAFETTTDANPDGPPLPAGWGSPRLFKTEKIDRMRSTPRAPNVLLVVIDTLRADGVHAFGCPIEATPVLDSLAARGIQYDQAFSTSSWTWPATSSIFTALYPFSHGVRRAEQCYLADSILTMAEHFQENHVTTAAFSANSLICGAQNFTQGFETFQEFPAFGQRATPVAQAFGRWLEDKHEARFFAYVHLMDPHYPYTPLADCLDRVRGDRRTPEDDRTFQEIASAPQQAALQKFSDRKELLRIAYEADVLEADRAVGGMLAALKQWRLDDRTIVAVTSDHGEEFFEHGGVGHARTLYDELIHVPLIVFDPRRGADRVTEMVETIRLFPTLCVLADLPVPRTVGLPPLPPIGLTSMDPLAYSTTDKWEAQHPMFRTQCAIRTPEWKLVLAPHCDDPDWTPPSNDPNAKPPVLPEVARLYDLRADPGEQTDVTASQPARLTALRSQLVKWMAETAASGPKNARAPSRKLQEQLEALGYANAAKKVVDPAPAPPDPRDPNAPSEKK